MISPFTAVIGKHETNGEEKQSFLEYMKNKSVCFAVPGNHKNKSVCFAIPGNLKNKSVYFIVPGTKFVFMV